MDIDILKRLALFGSPVARAAALTLLDELSEGKLLKKLERDDHDSCKQTTN